MKKLTLNHEETPVNLVSINKELEALLANDELNDKRLLELIEERDELICEYLNSLDEDAKKSFAIAEIEINTKLTHVAQTLFKASLSKLSGLVRGRKAVEKYK